MNHLYSKQKIHPLMYRLEVFISFLLSKKHKTDFVSFEAFFKNLISGGNTDVLRNSLDNSDTLKRIYSNIIGNDNKYINTIRILNSFKKYLSNSTDILLETKAFYNQVLFNTIKQINCPHIKNNNLMVNHNASSYYMANSNDLTSFKVLIDKSNILGFIVEYDYNNKCLLFQKPSSYGISTVNGNKILEDYLKDTSFGIEWSKSSEDDYIEYIFGKYDKSNLNLVYIGIKSSTGRIFSCSCSEFTNSTITEAFIYGFPNYKLHVLNISFCEKSNIIDIEPSFKLNAKISKSPSNYLINLFFITNSKSRDELSLSTTSRLEEILTSLSNEKYIEEEKIIPMLTYDHEKAKLLYFYSIYSDLFIKNFISPNLKSNNKKSLIFSNPSLFINESLKINKIDFFIINKINFDDLLKAFTLNIHCDVNKYVMIYKDFIELCHKEIHSDLHQAIEENNNYYYSFNNRKNKTEEFLLHLKGKLTSMDHIFNSFNSTNKASVELKQVKIIENNESNENKWNMLACKLKRKSKIYLIQIYCLKESLSTLQENENNIKLFNKYVYNTIDKEEFLDPIEFLYKETIKYNFINKLQNQQFKLSFNFTQNNNNNNNNNKVIGMNVINTRSSIILNKRLSIINSNITISKTKPIEEYKIYLKNTKFDYYDNIIKEDKGNNKFNSNTLFSDIIENSQIIIKFNKDYEDFIYPSDEESKENKMNSHNYTNLVSNFYNKYLIIQAENKTKQISRISLSEIASVSIFKIYQSQEKPGMNEFSDPNFQPCLSSVLSISNHLNMEVLELIGIRVNDITFKRIKEILNTDDYVIYYSNISTSNITQNNLKIDGLINSISSLEIYPEMIDRVFLYNKTKTINNSYHITLRINGEWKIIILDDYFPCDLTGNLIFSKLRNNEIWLYVLEKSFAKVFGSYMNLTNKSVVDIMSCLTNAVIDIFEIKPNMSNNLVMKEIENNLDFVLYAYTGYLNNELHIIEREHKSLVSGYYYQILSIEKSKYIRLKNALFTELQWSNSNDNSFLIEIKDFTKYFTQIAIVKVHPTYSYSNIKFKSERKEIIKSISTKRDLTIADAVYNKSNQSRFIINNSPKIIEFRFNNQSSTAHLYIQFFNKSRHVYYKNKSCISNTFGYVILVNKDNNQIIQSNFSNDESFYIEVKVNTSNNYYLISDTSFRYDINKPKQGYNIGFYSSEDLISYVHDFQNSNEDENYDSNKSNELFSLYMSLSTSSNFIISAFNSSIDVIKSIIYENNKEALNSSDSLKVIMSLTNTNSFPFDYIITNTQHNIEFELKSDGYNTANEQNILSSINNIILLRKINTQAKIHSIRLHIHDILNKPYITKNFDVISINNDVIELKANSLNNISLLEFS